MIVCADCSASNRNGSRFCSNCGHALAGETPVRCPQCQALNDSKSNYCAFCGLSLAPSVVDKLSEAELPPGLGASGFALAEPQAGGLTSPEFGPPSWLYQETPTGVHSPASQLSNADTEHLANGRSNRYLSDISGAFSANAGWLPPAPLD